MKISVVVATYNGEKYIYQQLESIRRQKRIPDEVIISDDGSADDTLKICMDYVEKYHLSNWKIVKTEKNLGYYGNFMHAIEKSSGDIIFLADQDDEWLENKIDEMSLIMEKNNDILSLASTFSYINQDGIVFKEYEKHPYGKKEKVIRIDRYRFFRHPYYLGMSMVIRRALYERIKKLEHFNLTHDLMLNLYASLNNGFFYYDKVLTKRRTHNDNTSGMTLKRDKEEAFPGHKECVYLIWRKMKHYRIMLDVLKADQDMNEENILLLEKFILSQNQRYLYIEEHKISHWIKNIRNIKYYETKMHFMNDLRLLLKH